MGNNPNLNTGVLRSVVPLKTWHHQRWEVRHTNEKSGLPTSQVLYPAESVFHFDTVFLPNAAELAKMGCNDPTFFWRFVWGFGYSRMNKSEEV